MTDGALLQVLCFLPRYAKGPADTQSAASSLADRLSCAFAGKPQVQMTANWMTKTKRAVVGLADVRKRDLHRKSACLLLFDKFANPVVLPAEVSYSDEFALVVR